MKILFSALVLVLLNYVGFSQHVAISNDKQNVAYVGLPNPLTVVAENISCKSLHVRSSSGKITKKADCHYDLELTEPGNVTLEAFVKKNGKHEIVGTTIFRGKVLPNPTARIGGRRDNQEVISREEFIAQLGMVAILEGMDINAVYKVTGFYMTVIRNNKVIFAHANKGPIFDDTINYFEAELTRGDRIVFSDIHALGPDKKERHLAPLELTIN